MAYAHHLAAFSILGALVAEWVVLSGPQSAAMINRLARADAVYGLAALVVLGVGTLRVTHGPRATPFYTDNPVFWTKLGLFAVVGLLSIVPTVRYLRWRKAVKQTPESLPSAAEVTSTRRLVTLELLVFAAIPLAAAAMARGFGLNLG